MIIQILADDRDFEDFYLASDTLLQQLTLWLDTVNENERVTLIDIRQPQVADIDDYDPFKPPAWKIGLQIDTQKKRALKGPLTILQQLAKQLQLDFCIHAEQQQQLRAVGFFGAYEGAADLYELAWQLKLK